MEPGNYKIFTTRNEIPNPAGPSSTWPKVVNSLSLSHENLGTGPEPAPVVIGYDYTHDVDNSQGSHSWSSDYKMPRGAYWQWMGVSF